MKNVKNALMAITVVLMLGAVFSACQKEELPVAGFDYSPTEIVQWDMVTFTNTTTKGSTYSWDFGDGSSSTDENPTHSFVTAGTHTVKLTATNEDGDKSVSQDIVVAAPNNVYVFDGTEYPITAAWEYSFMGGTSYWRMSGDLFPGADPDTSYNLIKFYPNIGTGTLEGSFTFDNGDEPPVGTFDYYLTVNYRQMEWDSLGNGSGGTLAITKFADDVYEFKLEGAKQIMGDYVDWVFAPNGYEPTFSVLYRGYVEPLAK